MISKKFNRLSALVIVICSLALLPAAVDVPGGAGGGEVRGTIDTNG